MSDGQKRIEEILEKEGVYLSTTVGVSMYPMLRNRRDTVSVVPKSGRLKKYDVPLYKRGDSYVLHRVIRVLPDGYDIRGDNCDNTEKGVPEECIIGVLERFWRGEKEVSVNSFAYGLYARVWVMLSPIVRAFRRLKGKVRGMTGRSRSDNKDGL